MREIVKADGTGDFLGRSTWIGKPLARPIQPVAQQMLAEACAVLLAQGAAELD